jgi:undecaprenyl-diphosphatase
VDEHLFRLLYATHAGAYTGLAAAFTVLGEGWVVLALLPLLFVPRYRARAIALVLLLAITAGAVTLLKLAVHRVRPCHALAGVSCLWGDAPTDFSFPSGHAAGSFAFATFVAVLVLLSDESRGRLALRVGVPALALAAAACIALSRVYLGVHFPGDVAAGSCLGALMGGAAARWVSLAGRGRGKSAPRVHPEMRGRAVGPLR